MAKVTSILQVTARELDTEAAAAARALHWVGHRAQVDIRQEVTTTGREVGLDNEVEVAAWGLQ